MTSAWILAGIVGGALAGLLDAIVAIAGGIGGMSVGKALRLVVLSASLLAAAGGLAGLLIAAGERLSARARHPGRWAAALWTLVCAPLVVYDASALFSGPRAARVAAHGLISAAAAAVGLAAIWFVAGVYRRLGARVDSRFFPGAGHAIHDAQIAAVRALLAALPARPGDSPGR